MTQQPSTTPGKNPAPASGKSGADNEFADARVLVVDDNQQNLELLQAYLESLPCQVESARDGIEALARIEQQQPDLILLDVMMPRMSGFEVCKKLKGDPKTRAIPIIMVTALNELGDVERGVESGTDDFVSKPVNKLELLTRVRNLLRFRQLKRTLDQTRRQLQEKTGDPARD